jgi:hypothetical protein
VSTEKRIASINNETTWDAKDLFNILNFLITVLNKCEDKRPKTKRDIPKGRKVRVSLLIKAFKIKITMVKIAQPIN